MFFKQITADCDYMQTLGNFLCSSTRMVIYEQQNLKQKGTGWRMWIYLYFIWVYLFVDCIFKEENTTTRFNTYLYICCFDPFCFSRQFHTTLINHQSDNLWLNDYCCYCCSCFCCCYVFRRKKWKNRGDIMRSLEGVVFHLSVECSFILISHAHPLFCYFHFHDFSVVDKFLVFASRLSIYAWNCFAICNDFVC